MTVAIFFVTLALMSPLVTSTNYSYDIQRFDDKPTNTCTLLRRFTYRSKLTHLHLNDDDTAAEYSYYMVQSSAKGQLLVAARERFELIMLKFANNTTFYEQLIQIFEEEIVFIEVKWFFGRIYVATQNKTSQQTRLFDVDLYHRVTSLVATFESKTPILITSDPFQGTVTYSVENILISYPIMYLNASMTTASPGAATFPIYEVLSKPLDQAICRRHDFFAFIVTSSMLDGYTTVQTYYVVTQGGRTLRCSLYENACSCVQLKPTRRREQLLKMYKQSQTQSCASINSTEESKETIVSVIKPTDYLDTSIHNLTIQECMRICPIPAWKQELWTLTMSYLTETEKEAASSNFSPICLNALRLNASLEQFGVARIINNGSVDRINKRLIVNFYKEFMNALAPRCANFELMYKYSAKVTCLSKRYTYTQINLPSLRDESDVLYVYSFDSVLNLTLRQDTTYLLEVYLQTPFDGAPYLVGTYLLVKDVQIEVTFTEPVYKKMPVRAMPYIYDNYWSQYVGTNSIVASILGESFTESSIKKLFFLLTNMKTNRSIYEEIDYTDQADIAFLDTSEKFQQIIFKIKDLSEDTLYRLRVFDTTNSQDIFSVSNLISFRTLKRPSFSIVQVNDSSIQLSVFIKCQYYLVDHSALVIENAARSGTYSMMSMNSCNLYSVFARPENVNNTEAEWELFETKEIYDKFFDFVTRQTLVEEERLEQDGAHMYFATNVTLKNLKPYTNYSIRLTVTHYSNITLKSSIQSAETLQIKENNNSSQMTADYVKSMFLLLSTVCFVFLSFFSLIILFAVKRNKKDKKLMKALMELKSGDASLETSLIMEKMSVNMLYALNSPINRNQWHNQIEKLAVIQESEIILLRKIGNGAFGEVFEGKLRNYIDKSDITVAIKKLKSDALEVNKLDLIKEAVSMNAYSHPNLVQFYGICFEGNEKADCSICPKYIVLEYMNLGDLLSYLRGMRNTNELDYKKALEMSIDVAKGCAFLEQMKMIHRDLAARNCLVSTVDRRVAETGDSNSNIVVKIGDFGLARDLYATDYYRQDGNRLLPIRWMSPESIIDGVYTTQSDVWSFGILLWEILTHGHQPYPGMENQQVIEFIKNGGIPFIPDRCPVEIRHLIWRCWSLNCNERPTFSTLLQTLDFIYIENASRDWKKHPNVLPIFDDIYTKQRDGQLLDNENCEMLPMLETSKKL